MEELDLTNTIENLRKQLVELVGKQGFYAKEVVELSQRLDQYIVEAQIRKMEKKRKKQSSDSL